MSSFRVKPGPRGPVVIGWEAIVPWATGPNARIVPIAVRIAAATETMNDDSGPLHSN